MEETAKGTRQKDNLTDLTNESNRTKNKQSTVDERLFSSTGHITKLVKKEAVAVIMAKFCEK